MSDIISWDKIIGKKVKSSDKKDLGNVESIASDYVEAKEGVVSKKQFSSQSISSRALTATNFTLR